MQKSIHESIEKVEGWQAALYLRLSKEDGDKEESDSIVNQRGLLLSHIQKSLPDVTVVCEKVDDGFSGTNFKRPRFIEMMEDVRAGKINCIIVKDLSRFGRDLSESGKYIEQIFPFLGVRFISVNEIIEFLGNANKQRKMAICEIYKDRRKAVF